MNWGKTKMIERDVECRINRSEWAAMVSVRTAMVYGGEIWAMEREEEVGCVDNLKCKAKLRDRKRTPTGELMSFE